MSAVNPDQHLIGETALLVKTPKLEPLVHHWRQQFDYSAAFGVPAHITVLYPFLDRSHIDSQVLARLKNIFNSHRTFDLRFEGFGRFTDLLYLAPIPPDPLEALTQAIVKQWPEKRPYGGKYPNNAPHVTIANDQDPGIFGKIEADIAPKLPINMRISSIHLMVSDGDRWRDQASFPLRNDPGDCFASGVSGPTRRAQVRRDGHCE
jgi:2'-5' RNA ligase